MSHAGKHRTTPRPTRSKLVVPSLLAALVVAAPAASSGISLSSAAPSAATSSSDAAPAQWSSGINQVYGIWRDDVVPRVVSDADTRATTLGVEFSSARSGVVSAIQFYASTANQGPHTGALWGPTGDRLATVSFPTTTQSGWKTAKLARPVAIAAGQRYTASYFAPRGRYADDVRTLGKGQEVTHGDLTAHRGTYAYGTGRPTSTWDNSNYYVDIVFRTKGPRTPPTSPGPTPTTPAPTPTTPAPTPTTPAPTPTTPAPTPTTPVPTPTTPAPTPTTPVPTTPAPTGTFPTRDSAGLPDGWQPKRNVTGNLYVTTPGQVVEDVRITNGTIYVQAPNVTLRRIQGVGGTVWNDYGNRCMNGLVVEDSEFVPNGTTTDKDMPVINPGGYTARNVVIDGFPEGLRVGGRADAGCGPVVVDRSFIRVVPPTVCNDWHGDGIQGYGGNQVVVRNTTIFMEESSRCSGTAPFFYPRNQGNTSVDIDGLLLSGGGYPFRNGMPGPVRNVNIVDRSWGYGPLSANCSVVSVWEVFSVTLNAAGQPVRGRSLGCTGDGI